MNVRLLKSANSKGALAKAIVLYQRALSYYASEQNWAVRGDDIVWLGDDDPTYAAQVSLGKRKPDGDYLKRNKCPVPGQTKIDTAQMGVVPNVKAK